MLRKSWGKINKSGANQKDQVVFLGIDLSKKSFQLHGVDAKGHVALKKKLNRKELLPFMANLSQCVIGIEACKLLLTIPGIGLLSATALFAAIGDISAFKNGREMAAWLGLVSKQQSTGGVPTLLGISKRGDTYLRTLLIYDGKIFLAMRGGP